MNDPSLSFCEIANSFGNPVKKVPLKWVSISPETLKRNKAETISEPSPPKYVDLKLYEQLTVLKSSYSEYDPMTFSRARSRANPFEEIGNSTFGNRAAVKMANIDAVIGLANESFDPLHLTSDKPLIFADVASGPGGFTQYLQKRYPRSQGYGITLRGPLDFNPQMVDMNRFTPFYGEEDDGDLFKSTFEFEDFIKEQTANQGVDLLLADGGIEADVDQEYYTSRLMTCQIYLGLNCLKIGGNFVLKVFDTVTECSAQLLFLLSRSFEKVCFFKPISSRPANSERYFIAKNFQGNSTETSRLIKLVTNVVMSDQYLYSLGYQLPASYLKWLTENNNQHIESQLKYNKMLDDVLQNRPVTIPQYNLHILSMLWNIPQ